MTRHIHVVGAGMAGLAAAVRLSEQPGLRITLWEATQRAGGRCWSFHDESLDRPIDNGNHLVLSGNEAILDYARRIGSGQSLSISRAGMLPFLDMQDRSRWSVAIPAGFTDMLRGGAKFPGSRAAAALDLVRLLRAGRDATVATAIPGRARLWFRLWMPLTLAVLNEPPDRGSAQLLAAMLRHSLLRGGAACRPVLFPQGLGPTLVDPALRLLHRRGVTLRWRSPLTAVLRSERHIHRLVFRHGESVELGEGDGIILAAAQAHAAAFPERSQPRPGLGILNAHFRVPRSIADLMPPILGVTSGSAHWIFRRGDVLSVTVSALETTPLASLDTDESARRLWHDVAVAAGRPEARPVATRIIRERHATWDQSPDALRLRPEPSLDISNCALAGDHVAGHLPATLEAAVAAGNAAAARLSGSSWRSARHPDEQDHPASRAAS